MLCDQIAAKLVAEEALSDQEQAHQETCPECRGFKESLIRLTSAVEQMRAHEAPLADEVENLRCSFNEHVHTKQRYARRMLRVSYAAVIAVFVGLVGLWVWAPKGPSEEDAELSATHVLALLDEVNSMYTSSSEVVANYPVQALQVLSNSSAATAVPDDSDLGVMLPGAYNSLNEWFSDRSL
jgi:hypothetical protein